ncbi:MAG: GWxTD domain-containing protein [Vicingus serpentipes]|nr:GWxTD domain-containing protein [Vicingus serpentipes]
MTKAAQYIFLFLIATLYSNQLTSASLKAFFTYSTFNSPTDGPYIETYLSVNGNSVVYANNENNRQAVIEITYIFKQGETIKQFKKYNLLSPSISDSSAIKPNFADQQRISLPNGDYEFEITIRDTNSTAPPFKTTQKIALNYDQNKITISDIELVESIAKTERKSMLSKAGYDILPYTSDFYPESFDKIAFYAEIYHTDKILGDEEDYLINYFIESSESNIIMGNLKGFTREKSKAVNVILKTFSIDKLPSGNYNIVIEVKNKANELLALKKIFFQRSNPQVTPIVLSDDFQNSFVNDIPADELKEHIKSIQPISSTIEINFANNQLKGDDETLMKQFFYNFWLTRNTTNPELEWNEYYKKVKITQQEFSTGIKKGYETDRGRTFLKYGKPNSRMEVKSEPNAYPYEIWHYHQANNFSNIKFVFYNPDLISNDYPLLHSNLYGEIKNPQWKVQLHKRTNSPIDINEENNSEHWGDRAGDYYNNPR